MAGGDGRAAIVTGGGGDIGRAIALELASTGAPVAVVDRDHKAAEDSARAVTEAGGTALAIAADVTSADDCRAYVERAEAELGPIAVLANNAGIEGVVAPITEYPEDVFRAVLEVNVVGMFQGLKHVLAGMLERGAGAVVNTASTSAIRGRATLAGYVASKHAVLGLTRVAALEVAGTGVRVNAVLPGPIQTRMIDSLDAMARDRAGGEVRRAGPVSYGAPEDVARLVRFLASDDARHVNGAAWVVDAASTVA